MIDNIIRLKKALKEAEINFTKLILRTSDWDIFLRLHKIKNAAAKKIDKIEVLECKNIDKVILVVREGSYSYHTDQILVSELMNFILVPNYYEPLKERYRRIYGHGLL